MDWTFLQEARTYIALYVFIMIVFGPAMVRRITKPWRLWYRDRHYPQCMTRDSYNGTPDYAGPYGTALVLLVLSPLLIFGYWVIYRFLVGIVFYRLLCVGILRPIAESCLPDAVKIPKEKNDVD